MLKQDHYEIIKFFIEINEEKRQEHIQQTKDNPLTRWKVQEYSNVLSTDIYLKDMRQFIKMIKHGKSLIIPKEKAIETMYEHIIKRLETAIEKHEQKKNSETVNFILILKHTF